MITLLLSILLSLSIISFAKHYKFLLNPKDLLGSQKFHTIPTPRIGGIPVFISFFIGTWIYSIDNIILLSASSIVFIVGLFEDITARISPSVRMAAIFTGVLIVFIFLDVGIGFLGFALTDYYLSSYVIVSVLFTLFVVGGVVNAVNIIDGYNGLMIGYSILVLLAIAYVANILGDDLVLQLSSLLILSLCGLFVFNFPFGKIFMGDGGSYFVGFMMAIIGLMLGIRNEEVSHWFILLLFIYPLYETTFSIYRKKIVKKTSPIQPDGYHLHMLIYKRLIKPRIFINNKTISNSMTSPFLWALSLVGIVPAVIWYDSQAILILWAFIFMMVYTIIYRRIVHFKFKFRK